MASPPPPGSPESRSCLRARRRPPLPPPAVPGGPGAAAAGRERPQREGAGGSRARPGGGSGCRRATAGPHGPRPPRGGRSPRRDAKGPGDRGAAGRECGSAATSAILPPAPLHSGQTSDRRFLLCLAVPTAGGRGEAVGEEEDAAADAVSLPGCGGGGGSWARRRCYCCCRRRPPPLPPPSPPPHPPAVTERPARPVCACEARAARPAPGFLFLLPPASAPCPRVPAAAPPAGWSPRRPLLGGAAHKVTDSIGLGKGAEHGPSPDTTLPTGSWH